MNSAKAVRGGLLLAVLVGLLRGAEEPGEDVSLPAFTVNSDRVANQQPAITYANPITVLRFEAAVDVQARQLAESQADIAIRGGTFENTGFKLGGISLYDPQTGHYFAEIPVAPAMLTPPRILTGARLATEGWNATSGAVVYDWRPIETGGFVLGGVGENRSYFGDFYAGAAGTPADGGLRLGVDFGGGYSESDGPIPDGDHEFSRLAARIQLVGDRTQTDLVAGRQDKFFGWPNLYTPFNSPESEDIRTTLVALNHRRALGGRDGFVRLSMYFRENYDDYRFNRYAPVGPVLPFEHTTRVFGAAADGRWTHSGGWAVDYRAGVVTDDLESTSLLDGRFDDRTHLSAGVFPERVWSRGVSGDWVLRGGIAFDDTNRDGAEWSPQLSIAHERASGFWRVVSLGFAQTTQVPTYTALNASATTGLFRGNPDLRRTVSRELEVRGEYSGGGWTGAVALFTRWDDELVDWTFRNGVTARSASAVDLETRGLELFARRSIGDRLSVILGYAWLEKDPEYGSATVDASFYALNFPRHRATLGVIADLRRGLELRVDNEARVQEENPLRVRGGDEAFLTAVSLHWRVPSVAGLQLSLQAENLWDSDFQEVPAVPATPRQVSLAALYAW